MFSSDLLGTGILIWGLNFIRSFVTDLRWLKTKIIYVLPFLVFSGRITRWHSCRNSISNENFNFFSQVETIISVVTNFLVQSAQLTLFTFWLNFLDWERSQKISEASLLQRETSLYLSHELIIIIAYVRWKLYLDFSVKVVNDNEPIFVVNSHIIIAPSDFITLSDQGVPC